MSRNTEEVYSRKAVSRIKYNKTVLIPFITASIIGQPPNLDLGWLLLSEWIQYGILQQCRYNDWTDLQLSKVNNSLVVKPSCYYYFFFLNNLFSICKFMLWTSNCSVQSREESFLVIYRLMCSLNASEKHSRRIIYSLDVFSEAIGIFAW